mgnify:CR=1 FL=1
MKVLTRQYPTPKVRHASIIVPCCANLAARTLCLSVAFAEICGAHGAKMVSSDALNVALRRVPDVDGPARVEIITDTYLV